MVPVPVRPDDCFDALPINAISFQLLSYALFDGYGPAAGGDSVDDSLGVVFVIFADAEVEKERAAGGVLNEE